MPAVLRGVGGELFRCLVGAVTIAEEVEDEPTHRGAFSDESDETSVKIRPEVVDTLLCVSLGTFSGRFYLGLPAGKVLEKDSSNLKPHREEG
ncbi:Hypothetical protein SMAX5B_001111 [Scophthalmus maximus]|uniref:Uncharacterized protein n=1 Tax=Scophthalmus maximus TaxID=52904 RepID=A0A2U9CBL0_SCOMX|nr:Hypothetical protein SMAX5B_001111 [Scophthalmus maximus]